MIYMHWTAFHDTPVVKFLCPEPVGVSGRMMRLLKGRLLKKPKATLRRYMGNCATSKVVISAGEWK
jgi:hypothetical protein